MTAYLGRGKGKMYHVSLEHLSLTITIGPGSLTLRTALRFFSDAKRPPNRTTGGFPRLERILSWHRAFLSCARESKFSQHIFQTDSHTNCLNNLGGKKSDILECSEEESVCMFFRHVAQFNTCSSQ